MKKLIIMAALTVAAFGFNQANAQKVIKDAAGSVFIDVSDMPGVFSTTTLNVIQKSDHAGNSVYKKLQIAKADLSTMNWVTAVGLSAYYNLSSAAGQQQGTVSTGCRAYTETGATSGWRVPTQKELQLMWIMKDLLVQMGATVFISNYYWTSTENTATTSWVVNFGNGTTNTKAKTDIYYTRCVREVTN